MDRDTLAVYDAHARTYLDRRGVRDPERVARFASALGPSARRLDLGAGPGHYTDLLGPGPVISLDGSHAMLVQARERSTTNPGQAPATAVQADLAQPPFRRGSFGGVWANKCLQHVPAVELPLALAELHHALEVDGRLDLLTFSGTGTWESTDDLPGRTFTLWEPEALADLLVGAGFIVDHLDHRPGDPPAPSSPQAWSAGTIAISATRARSLPDIVGPGMRLLISGLNPSLYAADAGVGFARPGNRFWPALADAGLSDEATDHKPRELLRRHGIGMTDLVKRASVGAAELTRHEYRDGLARIERLCGLLRPAAVCFVGLAGWRAAVKRTAVAGWQESTLGDTPVYVMPNTSGLNARTPRSVFATHLRAAISVNARPAAPNGATT